MRTPPLLADFIHHRVCKPICEKLLTLPSCNPAVYEVIVPASNVSVRTLPKLKHSRLCSRECFRRRILAYAWFSVTAVTTVTMFLKQRRSFLSRHSRRGRHAFGSDFVSVIVLPECVRVFS